MAYRFSHPVPLGTPSLDYGEVTVPAGGVGVTQKGSVWFPPAATATEFIARWAQDDWKVVRRIPVSDLPRYKAATVRTFSDAPSGYFYAAQLVGKAPAAAPAAAPATTPAAPAMPAYAPGVYAPVPTTPDAANPPAPSGSVMDKPWFWPAVGAGAIGVVALVWALTPARTVVRKAASRFMGF